MIYRFFAISIALLMLAGCTQAQLGAHVGKQMVSKTQGTFKVGTPYKIKGKWYTPKESYDHTEVGVASWYGPNFHGKKTANGEIFDKRELTAAHRTLQMPSLIRVTNLKNGRSIVLRVNDRGPFAHNRVLDVSERAAELLDFKVAGTTKVKIELLEKQSRQLASAAKRGVDTGGTEIAFNKEIARPRPASLTPVQAQQLPVKEQQLAAFSEVPGTVSQGRFLPDPVVINTLDAPGRVKGIFIQAGSFGNPANAHNLAGRLGKIASSNVVPVDVNGAIYHRVKLGPFETMAQAHSALTEAAAAGQSNAIIIVD